MQRSRLRKLERLAGGSPSKRPSTMSLVMRRAPIAAAIMAALPRAYAADAPSTGANDTGGALQEVVVTAEKRTENLQDVPVSITA
ncbi:MAG TPA: hypothetical protein VFO23_06065, partial [Steroidobacteraceae bacterium]|nr:hypothetical protein [Steroidobacteraceae bacterium]